MTNKLLSFVLAMLMSLVTSVVYADEHEYVDLGLPSGTLWATCNVGANSPEEFGDYIAWGETTGFMNGKTNFDWNTYKYCKGSEKTLTKYCNDSNYGYNGFMDNLTELQLEDDAACAKWGVDWCTPSETQFSELINSSYTTTEWTTLNGVKGRKITSKKNGNSIFLPAAGVRSGSSYYNEGEYGCFLSSSLGTGYEPVYATTIAIRSSGISIEKEGRCNGKSLRPVRRIKIERHEYVDLGLPSGTLWATCNVGADSPEEYGDYFAWGETVTKDEYSWSTYKYCNGTNSSITKYCTSSTYGKNDNKTKLDLQDDVAYVKWGSSWCMPSSEQFDELRSQCEWIHTFVNEVDGYLIKSKINGNSIFMPTAGNRLDTSYEVQGTHGFYWSSTLRSDKPRYAYNIFFGLELGGLSEDNSSLRIRGCSIRPVRLTIPVTGISLNYGTCTLGRIGMTIQLQATIIPNEAAEKGVIWSSSNEAVCTVSNTGLVTAIGNGTADITATTVEGGFTATCNVKVEDKTPVTSIDAEALGYKVYDLQGRECKRLQKGINIIRFSDGSTKKVLNK